MGYFDDLYDKIAPDLFKDEKGETAARIEQINKESDARAQLLAAPQQKIADALKQHSNATHGRLSTLEAEWLVVRDDPGGGHLAPPEEWYKEQREVQKRDQDLTNAEKNYSDHLQNFKDSLAYSHAARTELGDEMGAANRQTEKTYFRTNLELAALVAVSAILDLFTEGGASVVLGHGEDWVKDKIASQKGGEKEKPNRDVQALQGGAKVLDDAQTLMKPLAPPGAAYGPALKAAKAGSDLKEVNDGFNAPVPQLAVTKEGEEGLDEMSKDIDNLPDSVDKAGLKRSVARSKAALAGIDESKDGLIEAARVLAKALAAADAMKVSWSKPKH